MKIAVTCENNQVFQHFGHTPGFAVFEAVDGKITAEKLLSSGDSGHGALATLLAFEQVDVLICGGIGGGAQTALANAGIKLFGGVKGDADEAVEAYLAGALGNAGIKVVGGASGNVREVAEAFVNGTLQVRADFHCNHHHGEHTCGEHSHENGHSCGSHSHEDGHTCGSHGCKH